MDINNKRSLLLYVFIVGLLFFMLHYALQAMLIINVPQAPNGVEIVIIDNKSYLASAQNEIEEAKYYHNVNMLKRNKHLIWFESALCILLTYVVFGYYPKVKNREWFNDSNKFEFYASIIVLGYITAAVIPLLWSFILPTGSEWLPTALMDYHDSQVNEVLKQIQMQNK